MRTIPATDLQAARTHQSFRGALLHRRHGTVDTEQQPRYLAPCLREPRRKTFTRARRLEAGVGLSGVVAQTVRAPDSPETARGEGPYDSDVGADGHAPGGEAHGRCDARRRDPESEGRWGAGGGRPIHRSARHLAAFLDPAEGADGGVVQGGDWL